MSIEWSVPAGKDLREAAAFIRRDDPETAARVVNAIIQAAESLDRLPGRGKPGRVDGTRELLVTGLPYIIVYRDEPGRIVIVRILHNRQSWHA